MAITMDTPARELSETVAVFLAPICFDLEGAEDLRLIETVTNIIEAHRRLIEARDDLAVTRQLRRENQAEYAQLQRKVEHGCANHACEQCD